jgi:hypothetical protein
VLNVRVIDLQVIERYRTVRFAICAGGGGADKERLQHVEKTPLDGRIRKLGAAPSIAV